MIRRFFSIVHLLLDGDIHPLRGCSVSLFVAAALFPDEIDKGIDRHGSEVLAVSLPWGNRPGSDLLVPDDEHVGDLLELRLADLVPQFLVLEILLHAHTDIEKLSVNLLAVGDLAVRDGDENRLDGREPHRKGPGVVFDQHPDEALDGPQDDPVEHDGTVLLAVSADVVQIEALRQRKVALDRGALPLSFEGVFELEVDLGPVEGAVALVDVVDHPVVP